MSNTEKKELIERMFNKEKQSPYSISLKTGLPIAQVYHYCRHSEEAKSKHKAAIRERKLNENS